MLKPVVRAAFLRETSCPIARTPGYPRTFSISLNSLRPAALGYLVSRPLYNWTQPFGRLSRQWTTTGAGSWRYDFQSALLANTEVQDSAPPSGTNFCWSVYSMHAHKRSDGCTISTKSIDCVPGGRGRRRFSARSPVIPRYGRRSPCACCARRCAIVRPDLCVSASPTERVDTSVT